MPACPPDAHRTEEFRVKMVTSDDDLTTDIVVEGEAQGQRG
jgi:hypothetical protein